MIVHVRACPGCGKEPWVIGGDADTNIDDSIDFIVFCRFCGYSTDYYETKEDAIHAWNDEEYYDD